MAHSIELPGDIVIWRYMSFTKFVSMLTEHALWFARPCTFDDKWEGLRAPGYVKEYRQAGRELGYSEEVLTEDMFQEEQEGRYGHLVSCWNIGENESDAMWRLYGLSPEGVAIRSTIGNVLRSVSIYEHGKVIYYDPQKDKPDAGLRKVYLKRKPFEFEQEYRFCIPDDSVIERIYHGREKIDAKTLSPGKSESVNMEYMMKNHDISAIVVAPGATDWFFRAVIDVCQKYGMSWLSKTVKRSYSDRTHASFCR